MKMFNPQLLTLSIALTGCSFSAHAQLMFSQYIDGNSNKKGLEIYNPDNTVANLANYEIRQYPNGATQPNLTVSLQGQLNSQSRYLVGHSALKTELGTAVQQQANLAFNGNDALVLYHNGVAVDRFGAVGDNPGDGWESGLTKGNSFKRTTLSNAISSIDPTAAFDLGGWEKWSDRNAFTNYLLTSNTPAPVQPPVSCSASDTAIADLNKATKGQNYTVRGVITADYRYSNGFSGFYVQTPDSKAKPDLSNAIFVYILSSSNVTGGKVGEEVILNGRLTEYQNQLQLDQINANIQTCNTSASTWIQPISVTLPFESLDASTGNAPKRYQGMLVKMPQTLTVSENYNYGRYGQLSLSLGRLYMPTNLFPALSNEAKALAEQNKRSKIELDDGYNSQNLTPLLPQNFSAKNTLRAGDQVKQVEGILEYRFNSWRIQPIAERTKIQVEATNPRPNVLKKDANQIRAVAFNVLNYDNGAAKGFPTERGATTKAEFDKQHAKIVSAMKDIDADVYGLMEIANNGYGADSAIAYLTKALGANWKYVIPPNSNKLGSDAIAVAIIYNSSRVKPINQAAIFDDQTNMNRVILAQSFQALKGGKIFTVVPNHLKSKGSCPSNATSLDADQGDGQGCWNKTRLTAVEKQMQWLAKNPTQVEGTPNVLLMGDLNSYAKEEPILALERANYINLLADKVKGLGEKAYSYVFGVDSNKEGYGGAGSLDHAIADANLYPLVKRTFAWHINADEPTNLDYNNEYKTAEQQALFYADDAYRSSDHDPIIVDLELFDPIVIEPTDPNNPSNPTNPSNPNQPPEQSLGNQIVNVVVDIVKSIFNGIKSLFKLLFRF